MSSKDESKRQRNGPTPFDPLNHGALSYFEPAPRKESLYARSAPPDLDANMPDAITRDDSDWLAGYARR